MWWKPGSFALSFYLSLPLPLTLCVCVNAYSLVSLSQIIFKIRLIKGITNRLIFSSQKIKKCLSYIKV